MIKPSRFIRAVPGLDLPGMNVTATGTRWSHGPDGTLVPTQAGKLRDDYNPATGEYLGKLIEGEARTNLLPYSQDFSAWNNLGATVADFAGEGWTGAKTAASVVEDTSTGGHFIQQAISVTSGTTYCFWVIFSDNSAAGRLRLWLDSSGFSGSRYIDITPSTGAVVTTSGTIVASDVKSIGGGRYFAYISATADATVSAFFRVQFLQSDGVSVFTGDGSSGVYLNHAQVEVGSYPTSAIFTNGATATRAAESVIETIHGYTGGPEGTPGTNLLTAPEDFSDGAWTKTNATVTANSVAAPLGAGTVADTLTDDATNGEHKISQAATISANADFVCSTYVRENTLSDIVMVATSGGNFAVARFDLTAEEPSSPSVSGTGTIKDLRLIRYPNGYFRAVMLVNLGGGITTPTMEIRLHNGSTDNYSGSGQSLYLWGAKLEEANSLTPYSNADTGHWYNPDEGTIFAEITQLSQEPARRMLVLSGTSSDNYIGIIGGFATPPQIRFDVFSGGAGSYQPMIVSSSDVPEVLKVGLAYKTDDFAVCLAGGAVSTDTSGPTPVGINDLSLASSVSMGGNGTAIHFRRFAYFPRRLPNDDLQNLTT